MLLLIPLISLVEVIKAMIIPRGMMMILFVLLLKVDIAVCVMWETIRCSSDGEQTMPEGIEPNIGRFPWLGIVQHSFYMGGKTRFAVTGAVLIHPGYVIAPAADIAKIDPRAVTNNTKFIAWNSETIKYSLEVKSYTLHPEFEGKETFASLALLELITEGQTGLGENDAPVLPITLPIRGAVLMSELFAVKITDERGEIEKEVFKMQIVENKDCDEFYRRAQLDYEKMTPKESLCAVSARRTDPCVWDGGVALISRMSWGYWKLLGFSVRGPGCGAPTRFLSVHSYLPWIDDVISMVVQDYERDDTTAIVFRRVTPIKLEFHKAYGKAQERLGQCQTDVRGNVLYKDASQLNTNMNHVQGFFFVAVSQIADFLCCEVSLDSKSVTNTAVWLEHSCFRDVSGNMPVIDYRKIECFLYYRTTAYIEFRFLFSHSTIISMTMYGTEESVTAAPDPFTARQVTDAWWPTEGKIRWKYWIPTYVWWYWL